MDEGKPRKNRDPSPVLEPLRKLKAFVNKLHNTQMLDVLRGMLPEFQRVNGLPALPPVPSQPNNTRWNGVFLMISTTYQIRSCVDQLIHRFGAEYGLQALDQTDWLIIGQVGFILKPFKELSVYLEGEKYPTVPEYLGKLWGACFTVFYKRVADHEQFHPCVKSMLLILKQDIGRRLWDTENDVTLTGLGLHPAYKMFQPPQGVAQLMYAENGGRNIIAFFARDFQKRVQEAILRELARLKIKNPETIEPSAPSVQENVMHALVPGLRRAEQNMVRPEVEIQSWFASPVSVASPVDFWKVSGGSWPLLQQLARANFIAQASGAASERVWSLADDLSGGDRARVAPENLEIGLILKKNTPARALIMGMSPFEVLEKKK